MKVKALALALTPLTVAVSSNELLRFFNANATLIERSEKDLFVADKGLPYFKPGLPVATYEVKNGIPLKESAKGKVEKSFKNASWIRILQDKGVKVGDRVSLDYSKICFEGSDLSFRRLSESLPLVKGEGCRWKVVETPEGFAVYLNGEQVFFAAKASAEARGAAPYGGVAVVVKPVELARFSNIPFSIDAATVGGRNLVAVAFPEGIRLYERVKSSVVELGYLPSPGGTIVSVQLFDLGGEAFILANAVTPDGLPAAFVAKLVGSNPAPVKEGIPYLVAVLDKDRPLETMVAQEFDGGFGAVYRLTFKNGEPQRGERLNLPAGFRADAATLRGDTLVFIDDAGELKVYKGSLGGGFSPVASFDGNFGRSYSVVKITALSGRMGEVFFPPRPTPVKLGSREGFLVAENEPQRISSVLASKFLRFKEAKLHFLTAAGTDYELKPLAGEFRESIQGLGADGEGGVFAATGETNPLFFKKGGKLLKLEFKYF